MRRLFKVLCSIFLASSISAPIDTLANFEKDMNEANEEQVGQACDSDNYHLSLVVGDFGLLQSQTAMTHHSDPPLIFVSDPTGKIVKNAQVVTTIVGANGRQTMCRALPFRSGYLVPTAHLSPGRYLIEAEIATDGWLLTDMFPFVKT